MFRRPLRQRRPTANESEETEPNMHFSRICVLLAVGLTLPALAHSQAPATTPTAPAQATEAQDGYVLGPDDVFVVTVLRHAEFSGEYLVPDSGVVQMPVVGQLNVSGMTLADVRTQILASLRQRLVKPEVAVLLKAPRLKPVYVLGDVRLPNVYNMKPTWGFSEALSAAGGLTTGVQIEDCTVIIERTSATGERSRVELPLSSAMDGLTATDEARGIKPEDLKPRPGDLIRIEAVRLITVYVNGKVTKSGPVRLRKDNNGILEALSEAEGILPNAAVDNVRIIRADGKEEFADLSMIFSHDSVRLAQAVEGAAPKEGDGTPTQAPIKPVAPTPDAAANLPRLNAGDLVIVPESLDRFAVIGYVSKPDQYPMPPGRRFSLAEAVAAAGGPTNRGRVTQVGLVRAVAGKDVRKVYDLGKYLRNGDLSQNPEVRPGDVIYIPESPRVEITQLLQGVSSLAIFYNAARR